MATKEAAKSGSRKPTALGRRLNELGLACLQARKQAASLEAQAAESLSAGDAQAARRLDIQARRVRREAEHLYEETFEAAKGLLVRFVNQFRKDQRGSSFFNEEYLAAARVAFAEAFEKWDPDKGALSTILVYRLRSNVFEEVARFERGGVSMHTFDAERSVAAVLAVADEEGVELTDEELAEASGQTVETVQTIRRARNATLSLNVQASEDGDEFGELMSADDAIPGSDEEYEVSEELRTRYTQAIFELVDDFTVAWMLVRRLGLDGEPAASYAELGSALGIAGETARTRCQPAQQMVEDWIRGDYPPEPEEEDLLTPELDISEAEVESFEQLVLFSFDELDALPVAG